MFQKSEKYFSFFVCVFYFWSLIFYLPANAYSFAVFSDNLEKFAAKIKTAFYRFVTGDHEA